MSCSWRMYDCVIDEVGSQFTDGAVVAFAKAIGDATSEVLKALNGVWMNVNGGDTTGPIAKIDAEVDWLVGYVAVASLLIAAIRMALDRKGQPMKQAFMGMWKVILVGAVAVPVVQALTHASDLYAQDVYDKADLGDKAKTMLGVLSLDQPGLILVFGLLVMLSCFVQICLMYIRIGVMITLVGTLPLAAASSMTGWGEGWWKKHIGWLAAWLLYKPAAALIIYSATSMTDDTENLDGTAKLNQTIAGLGMLILAVFALPALLKLIVPATAALGGTSGGTVTVNAVNNVATGAVSIAAGGAAQGAAGPQGSPSAGAGSSASGGAGGAAAGGAAAAGAATGGTTLAVQAAAVAVQTGVAAASEVANSLNDNDGMKGHNQ
ncbi:hypothetical protein [Streptomyces sp. NBC_00151]|uniref:hypothetical protein n=1 Tax=Streptomyces sp. NBC_00151 TaxID=2975669 RepID=UPI002DD9656F|nr:hypothetical protein [Streptomyces sp. NBC_00151]WRZ40102.1 hypothetical protein OG915_19865 [Streptomyces sp. NBC_00151]